MTAKKKATKAPPAKKTVGAAALAKVYKVKKMFPMGNRAAFCKVVPKEGATVEVLAKKACIPLQRAINRARWLTANGYLTRD
jgi:hypothetical protein